MIAASLLLLAAAASADGVKSYDAGDFAAAAARFEEQAEREPGSAVHHYNLGNALFKQGRLGRAIASYQRAFDLEPRDGDIRFNLQFALKRAGEDLVPSGVPSALYAIFFGLSARELAGLHWLACWAALLLASAFLFREAWRPGLLVPLAAAAGLWATAGGWWAARVGLAPEEPAVIIRENAEIRSGPGENFGVSFTAPEGRRVQVLTESGAWVEIGLLKEGSKGWINAEAIEKI